MSALSVVNAWRAPRAGSRVSPALLWGAALAAAAPVFVSRLVDNDLWWHVRTGQWIVEHGRLPSHDLYTYTVPGHPWVDYEYLSEVLMWLVYAHLGMVGISIAFAALAWMGFLFLARSVWLEQPPFLIGAAGLALAVWAASNLWGARPQIVTFTFGSVELFWLRRFLARGGRSILALPALVVLWANLHSSWPAALGLLGLAVVAEGLAWLTSREREVHRANLRTLGLVGLGVLVAPLVTPNGPRGYLAPLAPLMSHAQQTLIGEWQTPNFHSPLFWGLWIMVVLVAASLGVARPGRFDLMATVTTLGMTLFSLRYVSLFVLPATPVLVSAWSQVFRSVSWRPRVPAQAAALVLLAVCASGVWWAGSKVSQQDGVTGERFPVAAADWLAHHPEVGSRMYNDYGWGGYLVYRFYPQTNRRVYVFGEASVMGDPLLLRYQTVAAVDPGWRQVLDGDRVDYVLCPSDGPLAAALATDAGWRRAYSDGTAAVYVRRAGVTTSRAVS